jgi:PTS system ascorbate-specific IIA component
MLEKLLSREFIKLNIECGTWKEAIFEGAHLLIEKDTIEYSYIDAIFKNFTTIGPYMVIAPGIVLSHARPEDGVNKLSMSLITLNDGVNFGSELNDPVKLVVTLAAENNISHLTVLEDLMDLFSDTEDMIVIMNSTDIEEVMEIIHKHTNTNQRN